MDSTDFELRDENGLRTMSAEDFRAAVTRGEIGPETFVKSVMTGHRWVKAVETPMYQNLLQQGGYEVIMEKRPREEMSPEEVKAIGRKILKVLFFLFLLFGAAVAFLLYRLSE